MAEQKIEGNLAKITGMSVAGGDLHLPKGYKYYVNLALNYEKTTREDLLALASGGSSVRVQAQAKLRADEKTLEKYGVVAETLKEAQDKGLSEKGFISFDVSTDFESEGRTQDPEKRAQSAFKKMDRDAKVRFIMDTLHISQEQAETMVPQEEAEEE